jgi:S-adenosyl-L-methionine hydrolase (adenosine-forming)
MSPIITLTTDFGLSDAYVAEMKGVILGINPDVRIIDVCHTVKPQNIVQAGFILSTAYRAFPERTIHVVVVDPGVGSKRRSVLLRTPYADFVAPDNGVLSYIIEEVAAKPVTGSSVKLKPGITAISMTKSKYWLPHVSATFHGRDIFAPVAAHLSLGAHPEALGEKIAAHLSLGAHPEALGEKINSLVTAPLLYPRTTVTGMTGHIVHVDNFGNLITNIRAGDLPKKRDSVTVTVGSKKIHGLSRAYAEGAGLLALIGSHGYMEVSLKNGNASGFLGVDAGDQVKIST